MTEYQRYRIPTETAQNLASHPSRFRVDVNRARLAQLLLTELFEYRGDLSVILSRPCVYGVFSGPVGGFAPREGMCVGCLRCTVQYPDIVQIRPNPDRARLGDSFVTPNQVDTILYEASTGRVPVRGAGYRGAYGGEGWDGMWTDMSEIVRPTRDGIHGREFISTSVDLGRRPRMLVLDAEGEPQGEVPEMLSLPVPFLYDLPPESAQAPHYIRSLVGAAAVLGTLVVLPLATIVELGLSGRHVVPLVREGDLPRLEELTFEPAMVELGGGDPQLRLNVERQFPGALVCLRAELDEPILQYVRGGHQFLHLTADYQGRTESGFVLGAIRRIHEELVSEGVRQQVSLIGSGGIAAAEHVPKAIIAGVDAVALDTPPLLAVQSRFIGEVRRPDSAKIDLPTFPVEWGRQRLINLAASWRDQLLEVLGAMGLREVRRLRGEIGRAMFQQELERQAFAGIEGYPHD